MERWCASECKLVHNKYKVQSLSSAIVDLIAFFLTHVLWVLIIWMRLVVSQVWELVSCNFN